MLVARRHDRALILALVQYPLINSPWRSYGSRVRTLDVIACPLREVLLGILELHVLVFTSYTSEQASVSIQSIDNG